MVILAPKALFVLCDDRMIVRRAMIKPSGQAFADDSLEGLNLRDLVDESGLTELNDILTKISQGQMVSGAELLFRLGQGPVPMSCHAGKVNELFFLVGGETVGDVISILDEPEVSNDHELATCVRGLKARLLPTTRSIQDALVLDELSRLNNEIVNTNRELAKRNKELVLEREKEQAMFSCMGEAVVVTDSLLRVTLMNQKAQDLTGWKMKDAAGLGVEKVIRLVVGKENVPKEDTFKTSLESCGTSSGPTTCTLVCRDGSLTPVDNCTSPIIDTSGEKLGLVIILQDITDRNRVDDMLRGSEARFNNLAEQSGTVTWEADTDGLLTYVSSVSQVVWGFRPDELVGKKHFYDLVVEAEREAIKSKAFEVLKHKERFIGLEHAVQAKDGRILWNSTSGIPLLNRDGSVRGYQGSDTDITARRDIERELAGKAKELQRSNLELKQFAYVASHDLKEPLRMVTTYIQLLERNYSANLDDQAKEYLGFASEGSKRMYAMVDDLLKYSGVETSEQNFVTVNMEQVMETVLKDLGGALEASGAAITVEHLPELQADYLQMVQLMQNLVGNAVKFHREVAPVVHISAVREGTDWVFLVRDNGIGIGKEYSDKVFLMFQRLNARETFPGTGIGLAVCKKVVERHGGRIWFESEPGSGSSFFFTIPAKIP